MYSIDAFLDDTQPISKSIKRKSDFLTSGSSAVSTNFSTPYSSSSFSGNCMDEIINDSMEEDGELNIIDITPIEIETKLNKIEESTIIEPNVNMIISEVITKSKMIKQVLLACFSNPEIYLSSSDRSNMTFLSDTTMLLMDYFDMQTQTIKDIADFKKLVLSSLVRVEEILTIVNKINSKEAYITDSFEIFELTLRRLLEQFKKMFPLGKPAPEPTSIIEDEKAKAVWELYAGKDKYSIPFSQFEQTIIAKEFGDNHDEKFHQYLRFFLNFPADDIVTTYKWNLLIRLFGPYDKFVDTFTRIALGRGFLGLINRIKANEILTMYGSNEDTFLIRFSRTEPEFLAFSFRHINTIQHHINCDKNKNIIPIDVFIKEVFPNYKTVQHRLDIKTIVGGKGSNQCLTLGDYSQVSSGGYIVL